MVCNHLSIRALLLLGPPASGGVAQVRSSEPQMLAVRKNLPGMSQTQRAQRSKNSRFRSRLKISIENEVFERTTHRGPIFCGEIETSRLKFSSEIKNFDRD